MLETAQAIAFSRLYCDLMSARASGMTGEPLRTNVFKVRSVPSCSRQNWFAFFHGLGIVNTCLNPYPESEEGASPRRLWLLRLMELTSHQYPSLAH